MYPNKIFKVTSWWHQQCIMVSNNVSNRILDDSPRYAQDQLQWILNICKITRSTSIMLPIPFNGSSMSASRYSPRYAQGYPKPTQIPFKMYIKITTKNSAPRCFTMFSTKGWLQVFFKEMFGSASLVILKTAPRLLQRCLCLFISCPPKLFFKTVTWLLQLMLTPSNAQRLLLNLSVLQ